MHRGTDQKLPGTGKNIHQTFLTLSASQHQLPGHPPTCCSGVHTNIPLEEQQIDAERVIHVMLSIITAPGDSVAETEGLFLGDAGERIQVSEVWVSAQRSHAECLGKGCDGEDDGICLFPFCSFLFF